MGLQSESDALDNIVNYLVRYVIVIHCESIAYLFYFWDIVFERYFQVRKKLFGTNKPNQIDEEGGPKSRFIRNPNPSPIYFKPTTTFSDVRFI